MLRPPPLESFLFCNIENARSSVDLPIVTECTCEPDIEAMVLGEETLEAEVGVVEAAVDEAGGGAATGWPLAF